MFGASLGAETHRMGVGLLADGRAGDEGALRGEGDGGGRRVSDAVFFPGTRGGRGFGRKYRAMRSPAKRRRARRRGVSRTLDTEAAPAPVSCCLAAGTNRPQRALAVVRSMVARLVRVPVRCGRPAKTQQGTGREPRAAIFPRKTLSDKSSERPVTNKTTCAIHTLAWSEQFGFRDRGISDQRTRESLPIVT